MKLFDWLFGKRHSELLIMENAELIKLLSKEMIKTQNTLGAICGILKKISKQLKDDKENVDNKDTKQ